MKKETSKETIIQKILYSVAAMILIGAVAFFGASLQSAISKIEENNTEIKLIKKDLQSIVVDLQNTIGETANLGAIVKKLEITTIKLETIIDGINDK